MDNAGLISVETLLEYLDEGAPNRLRDYFCSGRFSGGRFERFAGGGDSDEIANLFTPADVVAVSMLGVRIPGHTALQLLEKRSDEFGALLENVPTGLDLWNAGDEIIGDGSSAGRLWEALQTIRGISWVIAGKLLARKRPRLLPVYDHVVKQALGNPAHFWTPLRDVLRDDGDLRAQVERLRTSSGIGDDISLLRVLDVAIWMKAHGQPEPVPDAES
ncbi:MAG: DUF6308 family protein [Pseudonocardiaceae bacterium]